MRNFNHPCWGLVQFVDLPNLSPQTSRLTQKTQENYPPWYTFWRVWTQFTPKPSIWQEMPYNKTSFKSNFLYNEPYYTYVRRMVVKISFHSDRPDAPMLRAHTSLGLKARMWHFDDAVPFLGGLLWNCHETIRKQISVHFSPIIFFVGRVVSPQILF